MCSVACCFGNEPPKSSVRQVIPSQKYCLDEDKFKERCFVTDRKCTDVFFLILNVAFFAVLIGLLSYCVVNGDINRSLSGYDSCGYICGTLNKAPATFFDVSCQKFSVDKRNEPYLLIMKASNQTPSVRYCVTKCETVTNFRTMNGRCLETNETELPSFSMVQPKITNFFMYMSRDVWNCVGEFTLVAIVTLTISGLIVVLLRFFANIVVWTILCSTILVGFALACYLSYKFSTFDGGFQVFYGVGTLVVVVVTIFIAIFIIFIRHKIKLVIAMFKEAGKAIADLPSLLFLTISTFLVILATVAIFSFFVIIIESAGHLQAFPVTNLSARQTNEEAIYAKDTTMIVTRVFNIFAFFWFTLFIFNCQDFIVAGAVSNWFYSRMKSSLSFPISTSFNNLVRYHLGSLCFGSLVVAVVKMIKSAIENNGERSPLAFFCSCFWSCIEGFLRAFSKNAYIIISLDGCSFCVAGKRAFNLIARNFLGVIAIKSIGDFVLILARVFIVLLSVFIGIELIGNKPGLQYSFFPIICCALLSCLISQCFFSVYEMTIDTIFLCFCEDCELNDGITRPYYMSRSLLQFVQDSKKLLNIETPPVMKEADAKETKTYTQVKT